MSWDEALEKHRERRGKGWTLKDLYEALKEAVHQVSLELGSSWEEDPTRAGYVLLDVPRTRPDSGRRSRTYRFSVEGWIPPGGFHAARANSVRKDGIKAWALRGSINQLAISERLDTNLIADAIRQHVGLR